MNLNRRERQILKLAFLWSYYYSKHNELHIGETLVTTKALPFIEIRPSTTLILQAQRFAQEVDRGVAERVELVSSFGAKNVKIPLSEFKKEHKRLLKILRRGTKKQRMREAREQEEELSKLK
jgi:hypothetical protein